MWAYQRVVDVSGCGRIRELSMFQDISAKYKIEAMPTFLVIKNKEVVSCF